MAVGTDQSLDASNPRPFRPILLVEDSSEDAELTLRALKKAHVANPVDLVTDGVAALDYLKARRPRLSDFPILVLLDLKLPKLDGFDVLIRLQQEEELRAVPVIVVTSSQEQEHVLESYSLGVRAFVRKPVALAPLSDAISRLGIQWLLVTKSDCR
jgi:two-component system, response regulator